LIIGEAGIGKTCLADAWTQRAAATGALVTWGRAWESGGAPAYWPWTQALRALPAGDAPLSIGDHGEGRGLDPPAVVLGEHDRFRLFDSVASTLRAAASPAPLVLVLDDLHFADLPSLHLLHFVARDLAGTRLFIIATYRPEAAGDPQRARLFARIEREGEKLHPARLSSEGVAALIELRTGERPSAQLVEAVTRSTEGTPLFVEELVRANPTLAADALHVPDGIRLILYEHVDRLTPPSRELLRAAAVIGRDFDARWLTAVVDGDEGSVRGRLEEALRVGILRRIAGDNFGFAHGLLRELLYEELQADERRRLHARVAGALESRSDGERASELAHHHLSSGNLQRARVCSLEAGRHALSVHAYEDALAHFDRAAQMLDVEVDAREVAALHLSLAEAAYRSGDVARGRAASRRALEEALRRRASDQRALAVLQLGWLMTPGRVDPELVRLLEEALAALGEQPSALRAQVMARLAAARQPSLEDMEGPVKLAMEAVALARVIGDRRALANTLLTARSAFFGMGWLRERIALDEETAALGDALGDPFVAASARERLAAGLLEAGEMSGAIAVIDAREALVSRLRRPQLEFRSLVLRAGVATMRGEFDTAEALTRRIRDLSATLEDPAAQAIHCFMEIGLARARYRNEELAAIRRWGIPVFARIGMGQQLQMGLEKLALLRLDPTQLAAKDFPKPSAAIEGSVTVGELAAGVGVRDLCARIYARILPLAQSNNRGTPQIFHCEGSVSRVLGLLAGVLGNDADARRHFEDAIAMNERQGLRPWVAVAQADYADHLTRVGGREELRRAAELRTRARATADELGMTGLSQRLGAAPAAKATHHPELTREGDYWTVSWRGSQIRLRDSKGLQLLDHLLRHADCELHVMDLTVLVEGGDDVVVDGGDAGPMLDESAKRAYRLRVEELRATIEEARQWNDAGRAAKAERELEVITGELARAVGLGGRDRHAAAGVERARVNVQRRLTHAIKKIGEHHPELARHLSLAISTGTHCAYRSLD
jgi:hypothetical protein